MWWYWRQRILVGVALAAAAYLAADLVNILVGARLEASVPPLQSSAAVRPMPPAPAADLGLIVKANLFQPGQRGVQNAESAVVEPPVELESTHRLVGTVTGAGSFGFAVLEEKSNKAQSLFRVNDLLPGGAQLIGIERYEIVIRIGSVTRYLAVQEDLPSARMVSDSGAKSVGVREVASNHWLIERRKVDAALANLPQLLTQARLIPNFSGGKSDGFRLINIKPNSFYAEIGLQDGDVLQRINGVEVKNPENLLKAFQQLKNESNINLDLYRRSQPTTLVYEIR